MTNVPAGLLTVFYSIERKSNYKKGLKGLACLFVDD